MAGLDNYCSYNPDHPFLMAQLISGLHLAKKCLPPYTDSDHLTHAKYHPELGSPVNYSVVSNFSVSGQCKP